MFPILFYWHMCPDLCLHYAVLMAAALYYISASFLMVTALQDETQDHMYARQVQYY